MDDLIATLGEEGVLRMFCTRIADGDDPREIARKNGMPWFVFRKWLEDKPDRVEQWELAKRCFADGLVWEGLQAARDADTVNVSVARLQAETYHKTAAKLSRVEWGEQKQIAVIEGLTMDAALGGFASALLEKLKTVPVRTLPGKEVVTVEGETSDVEMAGEGKLRFGGEKNFGSS